MSIVVLSVVSLLTTVACGDGNASSPGVVATFEVAGRESFKVELTTPELVDHAKRLVEGEAIAAIPIGRIVYDDPGVNAPWSWHLDSSTMEFADVAIEVCDGLPSYVENGTVTSDHYCPWSAKVIAIDEI